MQCIKESGRAAPMLAALAGDIEQACRGAPADLPAAVERALCRHAALASLVPPAQRAGNPAGYARHLLYADPLGRFSVVALVWLPGQRTPVHAHYTWCAYRVAEGALREDRYRWNPQRGEAELAETVGRTAGQTGCGHAGYEQIHRLGNAGQGPALSIHVYGIDAERVATHVNRLAAAA